MKLTKTEAVLIESLYDAACTLDGVEGPRCQAMRSGIRRTLTTLSITFKSGYGAEVLTINDIHIK